MINPGDKFGVLTALRIHGKTARWQEIWVCLCVCGKEATFRCDSLLCPKNQYKRCVCNRKNGRGRIGHGQSRKRIYRVWKHIRERCTKPTAAHYEHYGGRGITLCDEWMNFESFYKWGLENGYSDTLEIDRINNDEGYRPDNCRFVTRGENIMNRRNTLRATINGETRTLKEWAELTGIKYVTIVSRLKNGEVGETLLRDRHSNRSRKFGGKHDSIPHTR